VRRRATVEPTVPKPRMPTRQRVSRSPGLLPDVWNEFSATLDRLYQTGKNRRKNFYHYIYIRGCIRGWRVEVGGWRLELSLVPTAFQARRRLTVERAGSFNARGDLLAKLFGIPPQPLRLLAEPLQLSQSLFIRREHDPV
jgi:hypothetical protein